MTIEAPAKPDVIDRIIAFENGDMTQDEIVSFFQEIIDSGLVWKLQGCYGRTAQALIDGGHCTRK